MKVLMECSVYSANVDAYVTSGLEQQKEKNV